MNLSVSIPSISKASPDRPFTRFEILVSLNGREWTVPRRFSSFEEFHQVIKKKFAKFLSLPPLPGKSVTKNKDDQFLNFRRVSLEKYLQTLLEHDTIKASREVEIFLKVNENMKRASQLPDNNNNLVSQLKSENPISIDPNRFSTNLQSSVESSNNQKNYANPNYKNSFSREFHGENENTNINSVTTEISPLTESELVVELHNLVISGELFQLKRTLQKYSKAIDCKNSLQQTLLHIACLQGNLEIMNLLLQEGADPSLTDAKGWNSLHFGARSLKQQVIESLIDRDICDINTITADKSTALHILSKYAPASAKESTTPLLRMLLHSSADPTLTDENGCTPLHYCAATGKVYWCEVLLKQDGVDVTQTDAVGYTPLHYACQYVQNKVVALLIEYGANVRARGHDDLTPLEVLNQVREQKKAPIILQ